ncbi:hypothetical protein [Jannaschia marina]|uniref:hypothetical protein n=1 Tax=Jannaschia marina TaxID=2741674 RepID=UPI0015C6B8FE|nr:hypothetical protein [Jannaschia marina]
MRFRVSIGVLAGGFATQQLAFAHLLDVAPEADFDQVEVLLPPAARRLAQYFDPGDGPEVSETDALVLLLPGAHVHLRPTDRLRVVGRFPGWITRALLPEAE